MLQLLSVQLPFVQTQPTRILAVFTDLRDKNVFWLPLLGTRLMRGKYTDY